MICSNIIFYSDDQVKVGEIGSSCGTYGGGRSVRSVRVGKRDGNRQLGRCGHRWEDNIEMVSEGIRCEDVDSTELA